jgi:hypothetical protein
MKSSTARGTGKFKETTVPVQDAVNDAKNVDSSKWKPIDWDGMTEEQAFQEDPVEVMTQRGKVIASQTWSSGSWSTIYQYKRRYFVVDEVEVCDFDNAADAFLRAGIGSDGFDEIDSLEVDPEYKHLTSRSDEEV